MFHHTEVAPPNTMQEAADRMEQMRADPKFQERIKNNDQAAFQDYNRLWRQSRGMTPEPQPPINEQDVRDQMSYRAQQEVGQYHASLLADGFDDEQAYAVINRAPISLEQRKWHENERARLLKDKSWVDRYMNADRDALNEMRRHCAAMALPVGTADDIARWAEAHKRTAK
jgi:hypothetical protein